MHSALPQVSGDLLGGRFRSRSANVRVILSGLVFILLVIYLISPHSDASSYRANADGKQTNGAVTISYSSVPYIHPDLSRLSEYRTSQMVTVDGIAVDSRTHSIMYEGSGSGPEIVLVVGLDAKGYSQEYLQLVLDDRISYASKHGYGVYARYLEDFAQTNDDLAFAKIFLVREAMFAFPNAKWMWWLDQDAVIMDQEFDLWQHLVSPPVLKNHMIRDAPILPPESVIHTYKRVPSDQIRFILTQNDRGVSTASFLVTNDPLYGHILMGYWMDPLHRAYQGFGSEPGYNRRLDASVTHMVQWHPAILSRMAIVPNSILCGRPDEGLILGGQKYEPGGFVYIVRSTNEVDTPPFEEVANRWKRAKESSRQTTT
jgi:mannan polymerase II complex MNN11 subunit